MAGSDEPAFFVIHYVIRLRALAVVVTGKYPHSGLRVQRSAFGSPPG